MTTATIYIERDDEAGESQELEIELTGSVEEYRPARLHGHPDTWSPAEGGDVEVENAVCKTDAYKHLFVELTKEENEKAKEALQEAAAEEYESRQEAWADAQADDYYEG